MSNTAVKIQDLLRPFGIFFQTIKPALMVNSSEIITNKRDDPPTDHAFETGEYEMSTAVKPPIAVDAITPALKSPA